MIVPDVVRQLVALADSPQEGDLPRAALLVARIEYPSLDPAPTLAALTRLGALATARLERLGRDASTEKQMESLNELLFDDEGFRGNDVEYDDPRNSFLNDVVARRTGLPITLSVVYMEVARRAGLLMEGLNFPGRFLVRCRVARRAPTDPLELVIDPFDRGAVLSDSDCRQLLRRTLGDDATFERHLLAPAGPRQILVRMLGNLKRLYVSMRSFPQARDAVEMILALEPLSVTELRDRGLLSYHLDDYVGALRDLEAYLRAVSRTANVAEPSADDESESEHRQIWEHVKTIRRRLASFN